MAVQRDQATTSEQSPTPLLDRISSVEPASLSNGVRTMVPPHVTAGTRVVVMTDDGSYVERAKD